VSLRSVAIRSVATAVSRTGLIGPLVRAAGRRNPQQAFPILTFHRVNDDGDPFLPALPTRVFEGWVAHLARHYQVFTVESLVDRAEQGTVPDNAIALTFDDGYRDNLTHAAPILARYRLPATIYLSSGFIGTGEIPWFDRVAIAIKATDRVRLSLGDEAALPLSSAAERLQAVDAALGYLKRLPDHERRVKLDRLVVDLGGKPREERKTDMLSWDDVHALRGLGFSIGAHTVSHPILSRVGAEQAWTEIHDSKVAIERALGAAVRGFAYPNGGAGDYTESTVELVRRAGFDHAVTTCRGLNSVRTPRFALHRGGPWEWHLPTFALKLCHYRLTVA
jgi:peptidoglycan/xylan/chitin deacetylase (PgdA/CDA1 family)